MDLVSIDQYPIHDNGDSGLGFYITFDYIKP